MQQFWQAIQLGVLLVYLAIGGLLLALIVSDSLRELRGDKSGHRPMSFRERISGVAFIVLPPMLGYFLLKDGQWVPLVCALPFAALGVSNLYMLRTQTINPEQPEKSRRFILQNFVISFIAIIIATLLIVAFTLSLNL